MRAFAGAPIAWCAVGRQGGGRRLFVLSGLWLTQAFQCNAFILKNKPLDSAEILQLPVAQMIVSEQKQWRIAS